MLKGPLTVPSPFPEHLVAALLALQKEAQGWLLLLEAQTASSSRSNPLCTVVGRSINYQQVEEHFQLDLALHAAAASAVMDDPDFSLIGDSLPVPWGGRAESMEYRYWVSNCLSYEDRVEDGFYEVWGMSPYVWNMCTDSNELGHMPTLDELRSVHPSSDPSIEVVLVDRKTDSDLRELENEVLRVAYGSNEVLDLASKLGNLVARVMGGSVLKDEDLLEGWLMNKRRLIQLSGSIVLPLGALRHGLSRHRALLYKVMADSVGLSCRLVRGSSYCSKLDAAMVLVKDSDDRECMVDLCYKPGLLTPLDAKTIAPAVKAPSSQFDFSSPFISNNLKVMDCSGCDLESRWKIMNQTDDSWVNRTDLPNQSIAGSPYKRNVVESSVAFAAAQNFCLGECLEDKAYQICSNVAGKRSDNAKCQQVGKVAEAVRISKMHLGAEWQRSSPERVAFNMVRLHKHSASQEDKVAGFLMETDLTVHVVPTKSSTAGSKHFPDLKPEISDATRSEIGVFPREMNERLSENGQSVKAGKLLDWMPNDFEIQWDDIMLGDSIGQGSYGKVYRADWQGSDVAVKIFLVQDFKEEALEEFRREVAIMQRLRHPNIVLFMGAVTKPPNLSILTEFCPRGSLYRLLHRPDREVDERRRIRMALDIAKGMNYLHRSSPPVVHRDLKSPNLLVDKNWTVKVCDFGLSRKKHNTFLSSKSGVGTPEWMAPEVLRNELSDEKSDVYSFGVILWELATLQQPWAGLSPIQVVGAVGFQHRRLPIVDTIDPEIANIIHACWFPEPKSRPTFFDIMQKLKLLQRLTIAAQ